MKLECPDCVTGADGTNWSFSSENGWFRDEDVDIWHRRFADNNRQAEGVSRFYSRPDSRAFSITR